MKNNLINILAEWENTEGDLVIATIFGIVILIALYMFYVTNFKDK